MNLAPRSLKEVAREFHQVRSQQKGDLRFPQDLWQAAFLLTAEYPSLEVALALGISPLYFKQRLVRWRKTAQN